MSMDAFGVFPLRVGSLIQPSISSCKAVLFINTVNYNTTQRRQHSVSDWEVVFVYLTSRLSASSMVLISPFILTKDNPSVSNLTGAGITTVPGGSGFTTQSLSMTLTMNDTTFSIQNTYSLDGYAYYNVTAFVY